SRRRLRRPARISVARRGAAVGRLRANPLPARPLGRAASPHPPNGCGERSERPRVAGRHRSGGRGYDASIAGRLPPWPPGAHISAPRSPHRLTPPAAVTLPGPALAAGPILWRVPEDADRSGP